MFLQEPVFCRYRVLDSQPGNASAGQDLPSAGLVAALSTAQFSSGRQRAKRKKQRVFLAEPTPPPQSRFPVVPRALSTELCSYCKQRRECLTAKHGALPNVSAWDHRPEGEGKERAERIGGWRAPPSNGCMFSASGRGVVGRSYSLLPCHHATLSTYPSLPGADASR